MHRARVTHRTTPRAAPGELLDRVRPPDFDDEDEAHASWTRAGCAHDAPWLPLDGRRYARAARGAVPGAFARRRVLPRPRRPTNPQVGLRWRHIGGTGTAEGERVRGSRS